MSTALYGFVEFVSQDKVSQTLVERSAKWPTWIQCENSTEILKLNWPMYKLPQLSNSVAFTLHDRIGKIGSEYIVDYVDYSPDSILPLPSEKTVRLQLLFDTVTELLANPTVLIVYFAITDCCQIVNIIQTDSTSFNTQLVSDLSQYTPSDTLYIIKNTM